jgi:hypothetical protein
MKTLLENNLKKLKIKEVAGGHVGFAWMKTERGLPLKASCR